MTRKVILSFPAKAAELPITYILVKQFDIQINILKASIEPEKTGTLLLELTGDADKMEQAFDYLEKNNVTVSPIARKISYNDTKCISCGNCASACASQALSIAKPDWKLQFEPEKCVLCKLCLKTCPLQLFRIEFSE